jgi:copper transport protein
MTISRFYRLCARRFCGICSIFAFALLQMTAQSAFAHAELIGAAPADGAVLEGAPAAIALHFNEPVAPLVFKLLLPDASVLPLRRIATDPDGLKVGLPGVALRGTYLLSWRVVSADGHPVGGAVTYSIGARSGNAAAGLAPASLSALPPWPLRAAIWLTRLGLYLALFVGVGAALFQACLCSAPPPRWAGGAAAAGLALLPLAVGLQGLDALALSWNGLLSPLAWRTALATAYGTTAWLMAAALLAVCIAAVAGARLSRPAAVVSGLLLGAALAASGHAGSAPPQWLARPTVFLHGIAIAAWAGSLLPLILLLRGTQNLAALWRFSRAIPWVLALLLLSGVTLATLQLDGLRSLWCTVYGRILSAKLVLLLLLLSIAAVNRYALTARVQRGEPRARRWMQRLIGTELGLVLLVLALVSAWRFTPPPRALAALAPVPIGIHLHAPQAMVDLTLLPQRDRSVRASLFVQGGDFSPRAAQEVSLQFSNPALGIEALRKTARRGADPGAWLVDPFALPASGRWHVRVDVLISDFERVELEKDIDVVF